MKDNPRMHPEKIKKIEQYIQKIFNNNNIQLRKRQQSSDSLEFLIGDETFGLVFQDDEDDDICYHVQLTLLDEDINK